MPDTVIIGNGISGITAARHIRKNGGNGRIVVISGETEHFFSRTALMYIYMGHMKFENTQPYEKGFWKKNRIELIFKWVKSIDYTAKELSFSDGQKLAYDKLILGVGSKPNMMGWPGQDLKGVQGLFSYQDFLSMEHYTKGIKSAVVVGGGLIGVEMVEMLRSRGIDVTYLVRELKFWGSVLPAEEADMIGRHIITDHHVDMLLGNEITRINGDAEGRVSSVELKSGKIIDCQFVGIAIGVSPNIDFLKGGALEINKGILVNRFLETNIPDVYAIGDCAEFVENTPGRRSMEQVWYTGRMMGEAVAKTVAGIRTEYKPNVWFNSAKLFDIEYHNYGVVRNRTAENEEAFYWEHKDGRRSIRLVFDKDTKRIIGLNAFGIRIRHEIFHKWIIEHENVEFVLEHLRDANFDPEFYATYESEIVAKYNAEHGTSITAKKKSWKRILAIKNSFYSK